MYLTHLQNALLFTVHTVFSIYISIVLIRFLLQLARADFYNPFAQAVMKITNPLLLPLRKIIPGFFGIDWSALVLALILQIIEIITTLFIRGFMVSAKVSSITGLLVWGVGEITDICLVILIMATMLQVIASWIPALYYHPFTLLCNQITAPIFNPIRRYLPAVGMLDFSPIIVIFLVVITRLLVSNYLIMLGQSII